MVRLVSFAPTARPDEVRVGVLVPLGAAVDTHTHVCDLSAAFASDRRRRASASAVACASCWSPT